MQPQIVEQVIQLAQDADGLSYYELLGIAPSADYVRVREAYHERAQILHPDRFLGQDPPIRKAIYALYKQLVEAHQVLSDPQLRYEYDRLLEHGRVRLQATSRSRRLTADERAIGNLLARVYYRSARLKQLRGHYRAAWVDTRLALSLERAQPLQALLRLLEARLRQEREASGT